ncbi:MAG: hypothetical protein J4F42_05275 [Desulfurellaceae bacterium]|nr:hypothetical protein [Desulfurellaceae bacterium]
MPRLRKRWPHCKEIFLPDNAKRLQADGYTTLNFDYRYFGESGGEPRSRLFELIHSLPDNLKERTSVGNPSDCRRRLGELRDEFGIEQVAFSLHAGAQDTARARRGLEVFAQEVMPEFV